MKIHKSTYQQMDEIFKEARQDKPVMSMNEVEKIVSTGKYVPAGGIRGFHIGMNTMIVVSGILISSLLTYFTLKENHQNLEMPKQAVAIDQAQQSVPSTVSSGQNAIVTPAKSSSAINTKAQAEPVLSKADKERPAAKPENLLASTENKIASDNASVPANTTGENEMPVPAATVTAPVIKKFIMSGFDINFNSDDDVVKMKISDDEVTLLSINDKVIPPEKYSQYEEIISEGKTILSGQPTTSKDNSSLDLITYFDTQLRADKILPGNTQYTFELSSSQLLINKKAQNDEVFMRYKKLYEEKTGKLVTEGSVYRFENGAKSE